MPAKEAQARIKINRLLEAAGWRFFDDGQGKANVVLEPNAKLTQAQVDAMGNNFDTTSQGFIDFCCSMAKASPWSCLRPRPKTRTR